MQSDDNHRRLGPDDKPAPVFMPFLLLLESVPGYLDQNIRRMTMGADFILAGVVAFGLLCYLVYAMFNAEKF
jgi:K+-transporting ATPase KdpF subunit